jgi:polar amino acid transport system substrate-binding protein
MEASLLERTAHDRRSCRLAGLAMAGVLLLACSAVGAGDLADVKARGKLVMLTYPVQGGFFDLANVDQMREPRFSLEDLHKPEQFSGIDVDLANGFARSLGVGLEIHVTGQGFGDLLPALVRRECDLVASELTITPGRREIAAFSAPYVSNWVVVVVRKGAPISTPADLAGKKAALLSGSSHVEFLKSVAPGIEIEPTSLGLASFEAVESGRADFTLADSSIPPGETVDGIHPNLIVAFRLKEIGDGIAVRQGSDLLAPLDAYLDGLKKSGELQRILDRHGFGKACQKSTARSL